MDGLSSLKYILFMILCACSRYIRAGFAGEASPRIELAVSVDDINDESILSLLNTVIIDSLQVKLKGSRLLIVEPLLCARNIRDLIYSTFVKSFQVYLCASIYMCF